MTQRTVTIEHPETHEPNSEQIATALRTSLADDGLKRVGDYTVKGYTIKSGGPSTLTLEVDTETVESETKPATKKV